MRCCCRKWQHRQRRRGSSAPGPRRIWLCWSMRKLRSVGTLGPPLRTLAHAGPHVSAATSHVSARSAARSGRTDPTAA
eukprot:1377149-Rhodomonas_salina.1